MVILVTKPIFRVKEKIIGRHSTQPVTKHCQLVEERELINNRQSLFLSTQLGIFCIYPLKVQLVKSHLFDSLSRLSNEVKCDLAHHQ